jgi:hypothetical protein
MAVEDAIMALLEHWDDVIARLSPEAAGELRRLAGELGTPGRAAAVDRIVDILAEGLPARHPVYRALVKGDLSAPSGVGWDTLAAALFEQARLSSGISEEGDDAPAAAEIPPIRGSSG